MRYQPLGLEEIKKLADKLYQQFQQGRSSIHTSFATLLHALAQNTLSIKDKKIIELFTAMMIFGLENTETWFFQSKDTLHRELLAALNVSAHNPLTDKERFVCLQKLQTYLRDHFSDEEFAKIKSALPTFYWSTKNDLLAAINTTMKKVNKRGCTQDKENVVAAEPSLAALEKFIPQLYALYKAEKDRRHQAVSNSERLMGIVWINVIFETLKECYPATEGLRRGKAEKDEKDNCAGLLLALAMSIRQGSWTGLHPGGNWFTDGSALYKLILKFLGIDKKLGEYSFEKRVEWIATLSRHLRFVEDQGSEYISATLIKMRQDPQHEDMFAEYDAVIKTGFNLDHFKKYQAQVTQSATKLDTDKNKHGYLYTGFSWVVNTGFSAGLTAGLGLLFASNPVSWVAFSIGGVLFVASSVAGKYYITDAVGGLYGWVTEKISTGAVDATVGVVQYSFGHGELKNTAEKLGKDDRLGLQQYVNALLFSDGIISDGEKERIRFAFAVEPGCKFKWPREKVAGFVGKAEVTTHRVGDGLVRMQDDYKQLPTLGVFGGRQALRPSAAPQLAAPPALERRIKR